MNKKQKSYFFGLLAEYYVRQIPFTFENTSSFEWLNIFYPVIDAIRPNVFVHEDNLLIADARRQLFSKYDVEGIVTARMEGISTTQIIDKIFRNTTRKTR